MPICDGCLAEARDTHSRERIERLELATRFRPIHIQVLLIDAAPPVRPEDFFYRATKDRSVRSAESRRYFDQLTPSARAAPGSEIEEESALADFQRRGLFLAYAVECPVENPRELRTAVGHLAPTIVKRIRASYKPRRVALLREPLEELIPVFEAAGFGDLLILYRAKPFAASFGERIAQALTGLPE